MKELFLKALHLLHLYHLPSSKNFCSFTQQLDFKTATLWIQELISHVQSLPSWSIHNSRMKDIMTNSLTVKKERSEELEEHTTKHT